jgi:hypothetical protein
MASGLYGPLAIKLTVARFGITESITRRYNFLSPSHGIALPANAEVVDGATANDNFGAAVNRRAWFSTSTSEEPRPFADFYKTVVTKLEGLVPPSIAASSFVGKGDTGGVRDIPAFDSRLLLKAFFVTPEDFGAYADDTHPTETLAGLQAATAYAHTHNVPLILRGGAIYRVDDPWVIGNYNGFATIKILCTQTGSITSSGCVIHTTNNELPGVIIQGCFNSYFADFTVQGDNVVGFANASRDISDYVNSGFSIGRYNPQCGIAIDPFTGSTPPGGGYPGQTYGRFASNSCTFERVSCLQNVCGVWIYGGLNAEEVLASSMKFVECSAGRGAIGFSSTSSQARNNSLVDCKFGTTHIGVDNRYFGGQRGAAWRLIGSEISECHMLFNIDTHNDIFRAEKVTVESSNCLGIFDGDNGCLFTGCTFDLSDSGSALPIVHGRAGAPMRFSGCTFAVGGPMLNMLPKQVGRGSTVVFESCYMGGGVNGITGSPPDADSPFYVCNRLAGGGNTQAFVTVRESSIGVRSGQPFFGYNESADTYTPNAALPVSTHTRRVRTAGTGSGYLGDGDMTCQPYNGERAMLVFCASPVVTWAVDGSSVQITGLTTGEILIGDILYWPAALQSEGGSPCADLTDGIDTVKDEPYRLAMPSLRVSAVTVSTHDTVTAFPMGDTRDLSKTYTTPDYIRVCLEDWAPTTALTATWTTGSTTITTSDSAADVRAGYLIRAAAGIANNTRVVSRSGASVVLSKLPTVNKTAEPIYCSKLVPA